MTDKELTVIELTEDSIGSMVYEIRGQKVMLDFDLARIYGYITKAFNQQVQRNIEKFPEDFMFQLTDDEVEQVSRSQIVTANNNLMLKRSTSNRDLRSQFVTANELSSKRRYNPYAFTEQGIYMLMTVLKGELAVKQSIGLIRLFKQMKDYIAESNNLIAYNEIIKLTRKVDKHDRDIRQVKSDLEIMMDNFVDPNKYKHFLFLNGHKFEANIAYQQIYSLAKQSIFIIDDYIDIKTLELLKSCCDKVRVAIFSENKAKNSLTKRFVQDFSKEYNIDIKLYRSNNRFHDRYIIIDYKTDNEMVFSCGSSSKDAGNKITTIARIENTIFYHGIVDEIIASPEELSLDNELLK